MKHLPTVTLLTLLSIAVSACKIVVTVPEGGRVVSPCDENGSCYRGTSSYSIAVR